MNNMLYNAEFWQALEKLVSENKLVIDRPKGTAHPRYPEFVYPLDYGYLENTTSPDGGGIDVWLGSNPVMRLEAIMCTVDLVKRDSEIKLLIGCSEFEIRLIYSVYNDSDKMKGILLMRSEHAQNT